MTSDTQMRYGSSVLRQSISLADRPNHARSRREIARRRLPSGIFRDAPAGAPSPKVMRTVLRTIPVLHAFQESREGIVVPLFVGQDFLKHLLRDLVAFLPRRLDDLPVEVHGALLVLLVRLQHLLEGVPDDDGGGLGGRLPPEVNEPLRDLFGVLHLRYGDLLQFVLHGEPRNAHPLDVLPQVLHGNLEFPRDPLVQQVQQLLRRLRALHLRLPPPIWVGNSKVHRTTKGNGGRFAAPGKNEGAASTAAPKPIRTCIRCRTRRGARRPSTPR